MSEDLQAKAPWYVSGVRTRHSAMPMLQIISEPTAEVLALVPYSDRTPKAHAECYADARLIAAAPDLLAALKGLQDRMTFDARVDTQDRMDAMRAASAAIAKAEARK